MAGQMLRRIGETAAPADAGASTISPRDAKSATGTTTSMSSTLWALASTMVTGRATVEPSS